jgi:hypothetical protein
MIELEDLISERLEQSCRRGWIVLVLFENDVPNSCVAQRRFSSLQDLKLMPLDIDLENRHRFATG